jgi:hypothetical protein
MNSSRTLSFFVVTVLTAFHVLYQGEVARAGSTDRSEASGTAGKSTSSEGSPPADGGINQQADFIQNNGFESNSLTYPNCQGACVFAIGRMNRNAWEAVAGVVWQFGSPDNIQAKTNRLLIQAQSENLEQESNTVLAEKLADAMEVGKKDRVALLAMLLGKRLGYEDLRGFLQEVKNAANSP